MKLEIPISKVMTKKIDQVSPGQKLVDVKHIFEKTPFHHHIPVVEKKKLVGMVSLIDFMRAVGNATLNDNEAVYQKKRVRDIMSIKPLSVKSDTTIEKVAKKLTKGDVHAFVVADKQEVKGMISYTDVIKYLLKMQTKKIRK